MKNRYLKKIIDNYFLQYFKYLLIIFILSKSFNHYFFIFYFYKYLINPFLKNLLNYLFFNLKKLNYNFFKR